MDIILQIIERIVYFTLFVFIKTAEFLIENF